MLKSLVHNMLRQGASPEDVVRQAMLLSREAFRRMSELEKKLDSELGSAEFRRSTIDPLLAKERQVEAMRARSKNGGTRRTDTTNLDALLDRKEQEYEALIQRFPWEELTQSTQSLVRNYIDERRAQLQLGDPERVRTSYFEIALAQEVA